MHCSTITKQNATSPTPGRTSPCRCVAKLGIASTQHRSATPQHRLAPLCPAERYYADTSHRFAAVLLHRATPQLCSATLRLCFVQLRNTLPSQHIPHFAVAFAPPHHAYTLLNHTSLCQNLSAHRVTLPMLCYAALCALCRYVASHRYTFTTPREA